MNLKNQGEKKYRYLKPENRKKILLLCDDIRTFSGVATAAHEFVLGTAHHFNWVNLGAAVKHPDKGKYLDLSENVNKVTGLTDSDVKLIPNDGYGDVNTIRMLMKVEKPDAIFIFTDPRYWVWLFQIEREIRSKIPIIWYNIWDDLPAPMYNRDYYDSVDGLLAISKQTKNINTLVLGEKTKTKTIKYVPHGINENTFFPITEDHPEHSEFIELKSKIFKEKDIEFVVLFNSRNIQRKRPGDVILSYSRFCDLIGKEKAKKCALVMHTSPIDQHGTDLPAVKSALTNSEYVNIFFSQDKLSKKQMNMLYNLSDVNLLITSNEGWGLSLTESMMTGTMIVANVTGGMQDQMKFEDENGNWIDFNKNFPSNHRGTYKKHGEWAEPVFPSNISLAGSVGTPYIFDDRCRPEDVAEALSKVYNLSPEERKRRGMKGREWVTSDESGMSAKVMSKNILDGIEETLESFVPRPSYDLVKIEEKKEEKVNHKLFDY